jgi:hypothetical protein
MLYPELFRQLESVRWNMDRDIDWARFDAARLSEEQAQTVKMNAITEWAALPATEMFLRDNRRDSDFSAFMSVWFFEEQKHSLVLMEYLRRFRPDLSPTEDESHQVRFEFDPAPALETLMKVDIGAQLAHLRGVPRVGGQQRRLRLHRLQVFDHRLALAQRAAFGGDERHLAER